MKDSLTEEEGVGEFFGRIRIQATYNVSSLPKGLIRQIRKLFTVYRSIPIIEVYGSRDLQKCPKDDIDHSTITSRETQVTRVATTRLTLD